MRLRALTLEKFGHFTSRRLEFRAGARLHVVYGANEAGKSSALAAVHNLLFGVPERTSYDFLHKSPDLRIGGDIEARGGQRLAFRRRKGRRRVLLDEAGGELPDDALAPFLGGMTEDVFTRAFGLDADGLRRGARELLASRGDVGESLMAAASGLRGLAGLRKDLEADADKLFAPRKSGDRLVYQILDRFEAARKQSGELELGAGKWKKLNEDIAGRAAELDVIEARRREARTRLNQITRLSGLLPVTARVEAEDARLAALGDLPDLRRGFGAELAAALQRSTAAGEAFAQAEEKCADIAREIEGVALDSGLVAHAEEIIARFRGADAYRLAARDLPRVQGESDAFGDELHDKAAALGLADAADIEASQPTAAAQARVAELIKTGSDLAGRLARNAEALAKEKDALRALEEARAARGAVADPGPLREKLAAFGDVSALVDRARSDAAALEREARALAEDCARLSPPARDLDALASASLPAAPAIARFRKEFDAANEAARDARRAVAALAAEITALESKLAGLTGERPVPSPERILAAREARDGLWAHVRAAAFGVAGAPAGAALAGVAARFEIALAEADRLADEGARDATRVAAWAGARLALAEKQRQAEDAARDLAAADRRLAKTAVEWEALWTPAGVGPLPPAAMTAWLTSLGGLLQRRDALAARRAQNEAARAALAALDAPLAALAREIGLPDMAGIDAGRQAERVAARIRTLAEPWDQARGDARATADARGRIEKIERERAELDDRQSAWTEQWDAAIRALNLRRGAGVEEARAALDIWSRTPALLRERKNRLGRVAGMKRDIEAFDLAAARIVAEAAPDLSALDAPSAIETLHERLNAARRAEVRHREISRQLAQARAAADRARAAKDDADRALAALAEKAPPGADLAGLADALARRDAHREEIGKLRAQLVEQAGHGDEARLRAELAGFDADGAAAERARLEEEGERLNAGANEIYADKVRLEAERKAWEDGVGAEVARQRQRNAEAELREAARDWAVLKIGSLMLDRALARHRSTRRDPLLQRAGAFFATLTGGAWSGLELDHGEDDQPRLAGRRASGEIIGIEGSANARSPMSTGTLDQLYLALRLAYVEDYCAGSEPVPFIGDDLFASFDEARAGHGVEALASLSATVQPILFTHHRAVVDVARARLGEGADVIEL